MSIATSASPSESLLSTLRAFTRALETRRSLQAELEQALSSFITSTPASLSTGADVLSASTGPTRPDESSAQPNGAATLSTCASEALRPPSEEELQEVLQIGFAGLVEIKEEVKVLQAELERKWERDDLARVVGRIEGWESERIRATLERDQLRRLQSLQPGLDFDSSIAEKNSLRDSLARQIQEEVQEVHAEIAELAAAAEE
ncbi:hypothetical protein Rt10032_c03g1367 [Rhodotorula toruloides]|uniref:Uncharacterized protein n=1 Tax=Rhodotorula toruloides TaxID=5286 RepID=A0A511KAG6_RHOTO|nr:hypothetical protein Rt10032_c03g1367 [Rhodotorula toruloides]